MKRRMYGQAKEPDREFSSTQVDLPSAATKKILARGRAIPDADLTDDGRETEPHITVKFGLHDGKPSRKLIGALTGFGTVSATLGKTSLFSNDDADVVKVEVSSPDLHRLNKLISRTVTCTDTHPTYTPHATVAYVKPGRGKKYAGDDSLAGTKLEFDSIVFSAKDRTLHKIPLTGEKSRYR
jgi:2'-5' RNA ligase